MSQPELQEDEVDFHKASFLGTKHSQDYIWDEQFLDFSKWIRKTYFKDVGTEQMQQKNKENFLWLVTSIFLQFSVYWLLHFTVPEYFWLWGVPLFFGNCYLFQFGEILHTRAHWPKKMTGSDSMDSFVDSVSILITGTSKESLRRRHIAAHYSDVGNTSRLFSEVWVPFSQFPSTFYLYPHKLLTLFLDVEYCRRENLSRQQLLVEMIGFYTYLTLLMYEIFFCNTCFLLIYHMGPSLVYHGAQAQGAHLAHSGVDRRNSFNSNGLFDWKTATGNFKVTVFVVDLFSFGGLSNHGIHHAHTQIPLVEINKNLREINAYCLSHYKNLRYNNTLTMNIYSDLYARLPEPTWWEMAIQAVWTFLVIVYTAFLIMGVPIPPSTTFENVVVDWRFYFYNTRADVNARWLVFMDTIKLRERKRYTAHPNAYLDLLDGWCVKAEQYLKDHPVTIPVPADLASRVCPPDVLEFNVTRPLEAMKKKAQ